MARSRLQVVAGLFTILIAACGNGGNGAPDAGPTPTAPPAPPVALDPVETPCLSVNPGFSTRGTVAVLGAFGPDAAQLSGIDWLVTPQCERIVFGFLTADSAPASSIGLSRLEFFPEQGILRVAMPRGVDVTAIADAVVDGSLIRRAFVVRSRSGELAVDLHMGHETPVEARGLLIGSPARLVVDVRPSPADDTFATAPPSVSETVVVLSPSPGAAEYPLRIRGYARTRDDVVTAEVSGAGIPIDRRIAAAPSADAWGEFAVTISEGPVGEILLVVEAGENPPSGAVPIALTTR